MQPQEPRRAWHTFGLYNRRAHPARYTCRVLGAVLGAMLGASPGPTESVQLVGSRAEELSAGLNFDFITTS